WSKNVTCGVVAPGNALRHRSAGGDPARRERTAGLGLSDAWGALEWERSSEPNPKTPEGLSLRFSRLSKRAATCRAGSSRSRAAALKHLAETEGKPSRQPGAGVGGRLQSEGPVETQDVGVELRNQQAHAQTHVALGVQVHHLPHRAGRPR